jgi:hypothetical protein
MGSYVANSVIIDPSILNNSYSIDLSRMSNVPLFVKNKSDISQLSFFSLIVMQDSMLIGDRILLIPRILHNLSERFKLN